MSEKRSIEEVIEAEVSMEQVEEIATKLGISKEEVLDKVAEDFATDLAAGGDMGTLESWLDDNFVVDYPQE